MMGRLNHDQTRFFYSFSLDDAVPTEFCASKLCGTEFNHFGSFIPRTSRLTDCRSSKANALP
jgi:hypothetical protein